MVESKKRSLVKALSWRFIATFITMVVVFVLTGELIWAVEIGLADTAIKFAAYFGHERIWVRIPYGLPKPPSGDYQI